MRYQLSHQFPTKYLAVEFTTLKHLIWCDWYVRYGTHGVHHLNLEHFKTTFL